MKRRSRPLKSKPPSNSTGSQPINGSGWELHHSINYIHLLAKETIQYCQGLPKVSMSSVNVPRVQLLRAEMAEVAYRKGWSIYVMII